MRNIELKARIVDYDTAHRVATSIATMRLNSQHQIDSLMHDFAISPNDLLPRSYGEMIP